VQALSDSFVFLEQRSKDSSLYLTGTLCSIVMQAVRAAAYYAVVPKAGWLLLPSLCCMCAWAVVQHAIIRANGGHILVPSTHQKRDRGQHADAAFDSALWLLIKLEALVWLGVVLLIVM
jgi:hypothetical protein